MMAAYAVTAIGWNGELLLHKTYHYKRPQHMLHFNTGPHVAAICVCHDTAVYAACCIPRPEHQHPSQTGAVIHIELEHIEQ